MGIEDILLAARWPADNSGITLTVAFTATPKAKTLELFGQASDLPAGLKPAPACRRRSMSIRCDGPSRRASSSTC